MNATRRRCGVSSDSGAGYKCHDLLTYLLESFHAAPRRRTKTAHPNLFAFLGHLERTAEESQADIA